MDWTSHTMERIPASGTMKMYELASRLEKEGNKIYHFEVGQPDFPTPSNIVKAGIKALEDGFTRYTPARGISPLLQAIEESYSKRSITIDGQKNVIVTPGAKMALFSGFMATVDRGDDVLILSPAWPTYRVMTRAVGAKPVDVPTKPGYVLDEEAMKCTANKSVTTLIINSPSNPTGGVLEKSHLKLIYDLAEENDFVVFSDEIYESIVYDGSMQTSMVEVDPSMEHTLVISGLSKSYAMTGWRLGYAVGNEETINNMVRIQQNTTSCATSFVQAAGVEALAGSQDSIEEMRKVFRERRDVMTEMLSEMPGVKTTCPKGAFYMFPDFSAYGLSSTTLAELLLKKTGVTTAPGVVFGDAYDSHLRFSYSASIADIEEGLARAGEFLLTLI